MGAGAGVEGVGWGEGCSGGEEDTEESKEGGVVGGGEG